MRVDLERFRKLMTELREINEASIYDLEIYEDSVRIDISDVVRERWKFTGLNNRDFIAMEIWNDPKFVDNAMWRLLSE